MLDRDPDGPLAPGSLPRPLLLGRFVRIAMGVVMLWIFTLILLPRLEGPPGYRNPTLPFLLAVAGVFFLGLLPFTNLLFGKSWGRWPQIVVAGIVVMLLIVDFAIYGRLWAPPLAWFLFLLTEIVIGLAGISLILAGLFAVPG